jgi:CMP-N,N'-diacetyllegionaminic acid synthase
MTRPEILTLVPARGGSKSIPRKNLIPVGGKPLIAYSIEQARASRLVSRTVVSTDDPEIAAVARTYGGEVPFMRPVEYAEDMSPDIDVFRHALNWLADHEGYRPDLVVHLRPTGPVRRVEVIDQAIALMLEHPEADALRSVSIPVQTPYKMWRIEGGYLRPLLTLNDVTEPYSMPRQRLPEVWWQNGYVDIVRPHTILELGLMCGDKMLPFVMDEPMLEVDYVENLPLVEEALLHLAKGEPLGPKKGGRRFPV